MHDELLPHYASINERNPQPAPRLFPGTSGDNPEAGEHIVLGEDESKILWQDVASTPNTSIFTFNKEDHTLGNLISQRLLTYKSVLFSAYKVESPLVASFDLRVQTDGSIPPRDAIIQCCKDVIADLSQMEQSFKKEFAMRKAVQDHQNNNT